MIKRLITYLVLVMGMTNCTPIITNDDKVKQLMKDVSERAFFEGQRRALMGDVRIKLGKDSTFIWVKSPWDDGTPPRFNPTYLETKLGVR
ncbi:MAG: hypothetical protein IM631_05140 [Cytophagales bacterium]|nr:hypothetical protein [Cytophagales bacterium]MCA6370766.1 hypothetical protein [Cytophagales bacterium]MCA6385928.1 hypothetical protein [Cytophagales bacterium]